MVKYPHLSLYATGSTDKIATSLKKDQLSDGWLPRCLYFISHDLGVFDDEVEIDQPLPANIADKCSTFAKFTNPAMTQVSVLSEQAEFADWAIQVPVEDDAKMALKAFFAEARTIAGEGEETRHLWGKAAEQADRIALVVACGRVHDLRDSRITLEDVKWGIQVVKYCIESFTRLIDDKVVESDYEALLKYVLERIKRTGQKGISLSGLTRVTQSIKSAERKDILKTLIESERVAIDVRSTSTKPATYYVYLSN